MITIRAIWRISGIAPCINCKKCLYSGIHSGLVFSFFFLVLPQIAYAQQIYSGVILDQTNLAVSDATIYVLGSTNATFSFTDGSFSISANPGDVLEISFIGYETQQIQLGVESTLKVILETSLVEIDEVVVTGYLTQKVKEITGSVAIVKPAELIAIPAGQVEQMLQGRVAGLNVISSGMPGANSNVRLHGIGNFGDVTPLYIIDGVQGNINNLNPHDIESIQVLKDAGAFAIYGVRGANGVIVVTTRNGKTQQTRVTYDVYTGTTRPLRHGPEFLSPQETAELRWLAQDNSGEPRDPLYGTGPDPVLPDFFIAGENVGFTATDPRANPELYNLDYTNREIYQIVEANKTGTDWFHEVFRPAFSQSHFLSVSGSNEKNKHFLSMGYLDQQGTFLHTYLKRYSARVNTEFSVKDLFRIGENLQLTYRDNPVIVPDVVPTDNEVFFAITAHPLLPVYDIKGGWAHFLSDHFFYDNPVALRTISKDNKAHEWQISGNAYVEADILKDLTARTSFGGNLNNFYKYRFTSYTYDSLDNGLPNNALIESSGYRRSWTWTNTLKYSPTIAVNHQLSALVGMEAIDNYNREVSGQRLGFFTNDVNYRFLSNGGPEGLTNLSFAGISTLYSLFGRLDYKFRDKYFVTTTLRRDASSIFGPLNRYGWFPSVSAAWRLTEEKFLGSVLWLDDLKVRASWGKTGFYGNTDPFNQYSYYGGSIGNAYYDIYGNNNPVQGFRAVRLGDESTGWQEDIVSNIGFEAVFWNNRLAITVDWYHKKAQGVLFPASLPDVLGGATNPNINVGVIQNTGFDVLIGSKGSLSRDFYWDVAFTFTTYRNEIQKLTELGFYVPPRDIAGAPFASASFVRNQVGHPVSAFYGHQIIGLFQNNEEVAQAPVQKDAAPGRFRYLDANQDSIINDDDRVFLGNPNPDFTLGLNISFNFRNVDFSTFCYGSFGNDVINVTRYWTDFMVIGNSAKNKALLNAWNPQNTNTPIPIIENAVHFSNLATINSYAIENGSYFRNKSVILGYQLPQEWLRRMQIEKLRIYAQALNLFTITDYQGLDPEISGYSAAFGIDYGNYPNNQKQYLFGINVVF